MSVRNLALIFLFGFVSITFAQKPQVSAVKFNIHKDLLLVQYDCKTDVDDLHAIAALATLLSKKPYTTLKYHAVAGTYGIQEGLYVPPNDLFDLAYGKNWSNAHNQYKKSLEKVTQLAKETLRLNGRIWIAEAGQSDFSADFLKMLKAVFPSLNKAQVHVVQHSDWNEKMTAPEKLAFTKHTATYYKIADGNVEGNGTPGFNSPVMAPWETAITSAHLINVWKLAIRLGNKYNGAENRYMNKAIESGGLDFSDFAEVCWILGLTDIKDAESYFRFIAEEN